MYFSSRLGLTNEKGIIDIQHDYFKNQLSNPKVDRAWQKTPEWSVLKVAIAKDNNVIDRVSMETGIPSRITVAPLVV